LPCFDTAELGLGVGEGLEGGGGGNNSLDSLTSKIGKRLDNCLGLRVVALLLAGLANCLFFATMLDLTLGAEFGDLVVATNLEGPGLGVDENPWAAKALIS
jgi:hypothetical protein